VFGANIGTTITGLLATIGQPRAALHAAVGLVAFKVLLVLIWLPLIGPLEQITRVVSPSAEGLALAEQLAYEVPRQVANVHLILNLTTVLILLPFTSLLAALIVRVIGEGPQPQGPEAVAPELNPVLFELPPLAIDAARREVLHLGERVGDLLDAAVPAILDSQHAAIDALRAREQVIDRHHAAIAGFIEKMLQPELAPDICRSAVDLAEAADYLESIGDLVDKEMIPLHRRHVERGTEIDPQARERLRVLAAAVGEEFRRALRAVAEADQNLARSVLDTKSKVRDLERSAVEFQFESRPVDGSQRLLPNAREAQVIADLDRLLLRYGGLGAYARIDQLSNRFLHEELRQLSTMATIFPTIFLSVAAFLLNLTQRLHLRGYSQSELILRMTREEIGSYLGLKLETVSRTFSKFQEDGVLDVKQRQIRITDHEALKRMVAGSAC